MLLSPGAKPTKPRLTGGFRFDELFTAEMRQQLDMVFARMESPLLLKLYLDDRSVSKELEQFITALAELSDKLMVSIAERNSSLEAAPCVEVCKADGTETGLAFHGIPSGTSLLLLCLDCIMPQVPDRQLTAIQSSR